MADNREDAMRQAVEMANKQSGKKNNDDKNDIKKQIADNAKSLFLQLKDLAIELWAKCYGKALIVGGGTALLLMMVLISFSSFGGGSPPIKEADEGNGVYRFSDAVLCVYEDDSSPTGIAYDAYAEIINTSDIPVRIDSAVFDISDGNEQTVASDSNLLCVPNVIMPKEKGYVFSKFGQSLESDSEQFFLSPSLSVVSCEGTSYRTSDEELYAEQGSAAVDFTVKGSGGVYGQNVTAYCVIYGEKGRCMGYGTQVLKNLNESEGTADITATEIVKGWMGETPVHYTLYVRDSEAENNQERNNEYDKQSKESD